MRPPASRRSPPYLERLHDELAIPVIYGPPDGRNCCASPTIWCCWSRAGCGPAGRAANCWPADLPIALDKKRGWWTPPWPPRRGLPADPAGVCRRQHPGDPQGAGVGARARLKIQARDVSIALAADNPSSIVNRLPARESALLPRPTRPSVWFAWMRRARRCWRRITRLSKDQLGLVEGMAWWQ